MYVEINCSTGVKKQITIFMYLITINYIFKTSFKTEQQQKKHNNQIISLLFLKQYNFMIDKKAIDINNSLLLINVCVKQ